MVRKETGQKFHPPPTTPSPRPLPPSPSPPPPPPSPLPFSSSPLPPFFCPLTEQDLGERIACKNVAASFSSTPSSSSQSQPDLDPLETRFRSVLPTLLPSYVSPSSPGKDREIIAIPKLLTLVYKIDGEMLRNFYVCAELIHMYGGLGCIDSAHQVFDKMSERNEVVWSLMISKYIHNGYDGEAMSLFSRMRYEEFSFNSFIMVSLIGSSARLIDLSLGSCIHGCVIKSGLAGDSFVRTSLVDMYVKCGCINGSHRALGEGKFLNLI
ncbi:pentatricopeptide repeat-containing protein At2g13600-like [Nymphaea colorata]|uniref:pentatricopeptide repeat-containing protein At2g13600-like n=1 Tax=Nymphaea colorata TaxID=210225 RepID=UPI00129E5926|nr:pentatricopeptide repeat-containing protein At2g13600-like [Nymphaea colorata]